MDFRALELRQILAVCISSAIGVGAALAGWGAWSLIVQAVAMSIVSMVSIWLLSSWRPRFLLSTVSLRRMSGFSSKVFFARFLMYGDRNADNLLVARFLGSHALGIYSIGYSVIVVPFERLLGPLQNVIQPAFASIQDDLDRMRRLWLRGTRLAAVLIFPVAAGVIVVAHDAVLVLLGAKWSAAAPIIQILAWVALIQSVLFLNPAIFQARLRGGLLLKVTAVTFAVDLASFGVGLHWGVKGVAAAYAIANTIVLVPANIVIVARLLDLRVGAIAVELRGVIEATVVMTLAVFALRHVLGGSGIGATPRLCATIAAGTATYALMCWWRERRVFAELRPRVLQAATTT
jgi:O-antigen/teichoic acid export membrane protein